MDNDVYIRVKQFKKMYPLTIAHRIKKHSEVVQIHLNPDERLLYAFPAQWNESSLITINTCVVAITNKRLVIGQKRVLWGYFFTTVTPDMYNDLQVNKNMLWSSIAIDTVKENIFLTNIDPKGAVEVETQITDFMMKEKRKYGKKSD